MAEPGNPPRETPPLDHNAIVPADTDEPQATVGSEGGSSPMDSPGRTAVEPRPPASPVEDLASDE